MSRCFLLGLAMMLLVAGAAPAAESTLLAPGAKVEQLAGGFKFTEGPAADRDGHVFFTDQPNDRILKWDTDGKLTGFLKPAGRSNGMHFAADGRRRRRGATRSSPTGGSRARRSSASRARTA